MERKTRKSWTRQPRHKARPYLKNNHAERTGSMAQMVDHLLGKHEKERKKERKYDALNSNPNTAKINKQKNIK
jgi:hypothetical protein